MMGKNKRSADALKDEIFGLLETPHDDMHAIDNNNLPGNLQESFGDIFALIEGMEPIGNYPTAANSTSSTALSGVGSVNGEPAVPYNPVFNFSNLPTMSSLHQSIDSLHVRSSKKRKLGVGNLPKTKILVGGNEGHAFGESEGPASAFGDKLVQVKQQVHYLEPDNNGTSTNLLQQGNNFTVTVSFMNMDRTRFTGKDMVLQAKLVYATRTDQLVETSSTTPGLKGETEVIVKDGVAKMTMKANVLSSKREGQLFRIMLVEKGTPNTILCDPVKVISKVTHALQKSVVKADMSTTAHGHTEQEPSFENAVEVKQEDFTDLARTVEDLRIQVQSQAGQVQVLHSQITSSQDINYRLQEENRMLRQQLEAKNNA